MSQLNHHLALIRIQNLPNVLLVYFIAVFLSGAPALSSQVFLGVIVLSTGLFFTNIVNDIYDIEIDRKNNLPRPLVAGEITIREAKQLAGYYVFVGGLAAFWGGVMFMAFFATLVFAAVAYSHPRLQFSHNSVLALLNMLMGYLVVPVFLGAYVGHGNFSIAPEISVFFIASLFLASSQLPLKDFRDVRGDALYKKETPLIKYGPHYLKKVIFLLGGVGTIVFLLFLYIISMKLPAVYFIWSFLGGLRVFDYGVLLYTTNKLVYENYSPNTKKYLSFLHVLVRLELIILATTLYFVVL